MRSARHWKSQRVSAPALFSATAAATLLVASNALAQNLSGQTGVHDPSSIVEDDGTYYLFYTGTRVRSKTSTDLLHWTEGPRAFNSIPSWTATAVPSNTDGNFWAPDIAYFNNLYHLYYSVSTFGSQVSAIGMATSPTLDRSDPAFAWTDHGPVIQSTSGSLYNTIDPNILRTPDGNIWMNFGSFWNGIYQMQIDPTTGMQKTRTPLRHLAYNGSIEASYEYHRGDDYYLFVNWGACCQGVNSTYNIRVGRSASPNGPFLDQFGRDMNNGGGTLFLGTEGRFIGPGQISILTVDDVDYFSYHYYDGNDNGTSKLNLRNMAWTADGWPVAGPPFPVPEPASGMLAASTTVALLLCRWRSFSEHAGNGWDRKRSGR
jgi:arabinan endo-1,5-alpha-L-arabinosidase